MSTSSPSRPLSCDSLLARVADLLGLLSLLPRFSLSASLAETLSDLVVLLLLSLLLLLVAAFFPSFLWCPRVELRLWSLVLRCLLTCSECLCLRDRESLGERLEFDLLLLLPPERLCTLRLAFLRSWSSSFLPRHALFL